MNVPKDDKGCVAKVGHQMYLDGPLRSVGSRHTLPTPPLAPAPGDVGRCRRSRTAPMTNPYCNRFTIWRVLFAADDYPTTTPTYGKHVAEQSPALPTNNFGAALDARGLDYDIGSNLLHRLDENHGLRLVSRFPATHRSDG